MGDKTNISWADASWPITTGCDLVSPGCTNCYAMRQSATRLAHLPAYAGVAEMRHGHPVWTGQINLNEDRLDWPLRWAKPRRIFVASMSDLFHPGVPDAFLDRVFDVMERVPRHTFQVLTKRPARMRDYCTRRWRQSHTLRLDDGTNWRMKKDYVPRHIWLGTSVEDQRRADERVLHLMHTPAAVRFLSAEPLLGPIDLVRIDVGSGFVDCLRGDYHDGAGTVLAGPPEHCGPITWVIAGGESGPRRRPMAPVWPRQLRDQCSAAGVAFWFKQSTSPRPGAEPYLDGFKWMQWPDRPVAEQPPVPYGSCQGEDITEVFHDPVFV